MTKHHQLISIIISLLYLIMLQELSTPAPVFRFLLPAVALFTLGVSWYNRWYLKQIQKYNIWIVLRQAMLFLAAFGIFLLLPGSGIRGLFLVITVALITFFEYLLGNFAENVLINETLLIAFGAFISIFGAGLYAPSHLKFYLNGFYIAAIFLATLLVARSFYESVPHPPKVKLFNSLAIALFCTEMFWALTFLPFHFSVLAVLLLNLFYFCLILNYYHLFQTLSPKKIQFHLVLVIICSGLVLLATPWNVIQ